MRRYNFKAEETRDAIVEWLKEQGKYTNFDKVVIGISGGKDSTIAAALCCRAFGAKNVHGLLLPNGQQADINDSMELCVALGIDFDVINIQPIYEMFLSQYILCTTDKPNGETFEELLGTGDLVLTEDAKINLGPRIRMAMIRLWGQSHHHRMCGTGNYSEITVGYCTKDGDTSCDFNPLGRLTSLEVVEIGKTMEEIPQRLVVKTPSDGLCGMTDEEKLGISYELIHKYIRGIDIDRNIWYRIRDKEYAGLHKRGATQSVFIPDDKLIYDEVE